MKRILWCLPLLTAFAVGSPAPAQRVVVGGGGFGYARIQGNRFIGFRAGGYGVRGYYYPYGVRTIRNVNVFYAPPPVFPNPIIINQPPVQIEVPVVVNVPRPADPAAPPPEAPLPGRQAGVFRPLDRDNRNRAERPVAADAVKPRVVRPEPARPLPEPAPAAEVERLLEVGRAAFAAEEYGRAAEHFARAAAGAPREAVPLFLLGQANFAITKYRAAVEAIQAGLRLRPDWPQTHLPLRDLYGQPVPDPDEHLQRLREALTRHANDPYLLFLHGYLLWLDGRRDEARPYFQRARQRGADAAVIELFLPPPAPGGRVL